MQSHTGKPANPKKKMEQEYEDRTISGICLTKLKRKISLDGVTLS